MSVNKLFKELRVQAIAALDAETRFGRWRTVAQSWAIGVPRALPRARVRNARGHAGQISRTGRSPKI